MEKRAGEVMLREVVGLPGGHCVGRTVGEIDGRNGVVVGRWSLHFALVWLCWFRHGSGSRDGCMRLMGGREDGMGQVRPSWECRAGSFQGLC